MKKIVVILMVLCFSAFQTPHSMAATDPRFFGIYCGETSVEECVRYRLCLWPFGWPCLNRRRCETLDIKNIRVNVTHEVPEANLGIIKGDGTAKINGNNLIISFGGTVSGYGRATGSMASNYFDPNMGFAQLSSDGLALTIKGRGKSLTLRKDACGNNPPSVTITSPSDGANLTFGTTYAFGGKVLTDEDTTFAPERMVIRSNRDGILEGWTNYGPKSMAVFNNSLSPGSHVISFSATDSGGLTATASINITVRNDKPNKPTIVQPLTTDTIIATGDIIFEGKAYDLEDGMLKGDSLIWEARRTGDPPIILGKGQSLTRSLVTPGTYTIRLTAIDNVGSRNFTEQTIIVQPYAGNTTPRVMIIKPEHIEWLGMAVLTGSEIEFVGTAEDSEDAITDLTLSWTAEATNPTEAPFEFGANNTKARVTLNSIGEQTTEYTITFSATDKGGLVGKKAIKIYVMAHTLY